MHTGGTKYTFTTPDLVTEHPELSAGDTISITYNAILNDEAVVADAGNPNTFHIEFSNDPNKTGNGTPGTGPNHVVIVFTFKTVFDKIDENNNPLAGADFELYKKTGTGDDDWTIVTSLHTGEGALNPSKAKDAGDDDSVKFTFSGLGQGTYKLVETQIPDGYNGIDPIIFTITASYTVDGNPHIGTLTGTGESITMTRNSSNKAELDADIQNHSGVTLPSTGGIGTTIFYIVGAVLVLGAAAIILARRKAEQE
ncbi:MAG: LPXTG cell wall anchor domain-containing protein [Clostridia bacterium]|nr:LPXTG cell wall anchor domain-containing protein [Clostridia bacterium]